MYIMGLPLNIPVTLRPQFSRYYEPISNSAALACCHPQNGIRGSCHGLQLGRQSRHRYHIVRSRWRWDDDEEEEQDEGDERTQSGANGHCSFDSGVTLFNRGEYYKCHDVLESLWHRSQEPQRTVLHGILQCSVGLYHLLNRNHRGAMTELGEGLAKLQRQRFAAGPFYEFEQQISEVLEYIYNTQLEHAACSEDICITMDGSQQSYQLLGNFAAGQHLYELRRTENDDLYICFTTPGSDNADSAPSVKVKVPILNTNSDDLVMLR